MPAVSPVLDDQAAGGERQHEHHQVDLVLKREAQRPLHQALQLREGDDGTRERHRTDQRAQQGEAKKSTGMKVALEQFHRGDRAGAAAAHAVVEGDHLRHVGHGHALAGPPGGHAADGDGHRHEQVILHARPEEGDQGGDQHAGAGPQDAPARRERRAHAFQPEDEEYGREEITDLDDGIHQCLPLPLLLLNISSMRSVTT